MDILSKMDTPNLQNTKKDGELVKTILAEQLGIETADIQPDDSFTEDLHMTPLDLTDFLQNLEKHGFSAGSLDLTEIKTLEDLLETLALE